MKRVASFLLIFLFASLLLAKDKKQYSDITIQVLKSENGKPVRNAAVVLHAVDEKGKQQKGGENLKTDLEGKTFYQGVPYGVLRIQVIAQGLQTYGQDYDINQPEHTFVIKMNPPQHQYTIYDDKAPQTSQKPPQ